MNREDFGFWGIDLDADAFAQALAAVGVLAGSSIAGNDAQVAGQLRNLVATLPSGAPLRWMMPETSHFDAANMANAWAEAIHPSMNLRLQVDPGEPPGSWNPTWIVEQLSRPAVGLASVFLAPIFTSHPVAREAWHWPLDVGLLQDDESAQLGEAIFREAGPGGVVEIFGIGPEREVCDLLLLPFDVRESLLRLLRVPVRASAVVILGGLTEPWDRARPMLETISAHARASAVVVSRVSPSLHTGWFSALMRELGNDAGLDVALHRAAPNAHPLIIAPDRLLRRTRMVGMLQELRQMTGAMPPEEAEMANASLEKLAPEEAPGKRPPSILTPTIDARPSPRARRAASVGRIVRAHQPKPVPRFLQARLSPPGEPAAATPTLQPLSPYVVSVRVGPEQEGWLHSGTHAPVEHLFAGDDEQHTLHVFFTDLTGEGEARSRTIVLRREGPSTVAEFHVQAGEAGSQVEARIVLVHRNRVLQTVKLRAVVGEPDSASVEDEIVTRGRLDDLSGRSRFDLAFIMNHTDTGERRLTSIAGERAAVTWPGHLKEFAEGIRDLLEEYVTKDLQRVPLRSKDMRVLLTRLAAQGHPLYETLEEDILGDLFPMFARAERIQVIAAQADAFFPIEFVYDLAPPIKNAELCPDAEAALESGRCEACQRRPVSEQRKYVCPLGFWGLRIVIERHRHSPALANEVRRNFADYQISTDPVTGRDTIGPISRIVFSASAQVDGFRKGTIKSAIASIREVAVDGFGDARTWDTWKKRVAGVDPQLLVILPHTVPEDSLPVMEVGASDQLRLVDIDEAHIRTRGDATPIILLLGCKTGEQNLPFQELPAKFRRKGAVIVLATLTSILGRHAAPVAQQLVTTLATMSTQEKRSFGDVLHQVRRQALLDGNPMVLALTAYGDADWQFGVEE